MPTTLEVYLHETLVGTITNLSSDHNVFAFDEGYVENEDRPILSLGLLDAQRRPSEPTKTPQLKLLPFFSNLLPEGHLRQYLASKGHVNAQRDFPLLWLLGEDLPGAVIVRSAAGGSGSDGSEALKFSLAGVQLKFSAVMETHGGLTIPVHGTGGDWILKLPSAIYKDVPQNEFAMMSFAREIGIDVPEMGLIDLAMVRGLPREIRSDLGKAFFIKRFDRSSDGRIHTEDFNQIYNQYPADKYANVSYGNMLTNIWRTLGEDQAREFIRRLIFTIGIGNADMHLKNWSVIFRDRRTPSLAPAYDYVSTVAYIGDDALALTIARSRQWSEISYDHLERFARKAEVPRGIVTETARETVDRMRDVWPHVRASLDVAERILDRVDEQMRIVPIFNPTVEPRPSTNVSDEAPREIQ